MVKRHWRRRISLRKSVPSGGRDFGLVWSVRAGISGVYCTQQTQLTTSSESRFSGVALTASLSSFSGPPFISEGGTKSCKGFGSAASLPCTAQAGILFAGQDVHNEAARDFCQPRINSSGERSANAL
jgi:hypothetical protein